MINRAVSSKAVKKPMIYQSIKSIKFYLIIKMKSSSYRNYQDQDKTRTRGLQKKIKEKKKWENKNKIFCLWFRI